MDSAEIKAEVLKHYTLTEIAELVPDGVFLGKWHKTSGQDVSQVINKHLLDYRVRNAISLALLRHNPKRTYLNIWGVREKHDRLQFVLGSIAVQGLQPSKIRDIINNSKYSIKEISNMIKRPATLRAGRPSDTIYYGSSQISLTINRRRNCEAIRQGLAEILNVEYSRMWG
jgi:hypothetical protein